MPVVRQSTFKIAALGAVTILAGMGPAKATGILLVPGVLTYGEAITSIADSGGGYTTLSSAYTSQSGLARPGAGSGTCSGSLRVSCSALSAGGLATAAIDSSGGRKGLPAVDPSIDVSANSTAGMLPDAAGRPLNYYSAGAEGGLAYYFALVLKSAAVPGAPAVPVNFIGTISFSNLSSNVSAEADVAVYKPDGSVLFVDTDAGTFDQRFDLQPAAVYEVTLHASAASSKGAIADAAIDPSLTIADPVLAALYDIVYSPDLVDAEGLTPVPEPSSWALLLACIGALWLSVVWQRSRAETATRPQQPHR